MSNEEAISNPDTLTLNEYQHKASQTAIYPRVYTEGQVVEICLDLLDDIFQEVDIHDEMAIRNLLDRHETPFNRLVYPILGLVGEAGEFANKLKKVARDKNGRVDPDQSLQLADEISDVLWYTAATSTELEVSLGEIGLVNLSKLASRARRGVISGSGDQR